MPDSCRGRQQRLHVLLQAKASISKRQEAQGHLHADKEALGGGAEEEEVPGGR